MYCTNCGKKIREEWTFCKYCGTALTQNEETAPCEEEHPEAEGLTQTEGRKSSEITKGGSELPECSPEAEKTAPSSPEKRQSPVILILVVLCAILLVVVIVLHVQIQGLLEEHIVEDPYVAAEEIPVEQNPLYNDLVELMGIDFLSEEIDHYSSDEEHISIYLGNCDLITSDYIVELGDGSCFQFPMFYKDLCDAGWQLEYESDKEELGDFLGAETGGWYGFKNADGKTVNANLHNYEKQPVALNEARVLSLQMGDCWTEDFSIKGISRGARVGEIVAKFGLPYGSSYYRWNDEEEYVDFYYIDKTNCTHLSFTLDPATGLLDSVSYYVSDPEWWSE